jgi:hypothetical protein
MTRLLQVSAALVATLMSLAAATPSSAQAVCTEGRTAAGLCVNPGLAASVQQTGIIFSQPKISYTAFPILPSGDSQYRYPSNLLPDQMMPRAAGVVPQNGNP